METYVSDILRLKINKHDIIEEKDGFIVNGERILAKNLKVGEVREIGKGEYSKLFNVGDMVVFIPPTIVSNSRGDFIEACDVLFKVNV